MMKRLAPRISSRIYDAVAVVPSDHGFAGAFADELAELFKARRIDPIIRIRGASRQGTLSRRARRENAPKVFGRVDAELPQSILLVDDVVTTGATINAAATRLFEGGARIVDAVAIARTPWRK